MYEFHGWFGIRETICEIDEGGLDRIIALLEKRIDSMGWATGHCRVHIINGEYFLLVSGLTNHRGKEEKDLTMLLEFIRKEAPGSYGLLFWKDDDEKYPLSEVFRVKVLSRGLLQDRFDPFLSPAVPVIEDE